MATEKTKVILLETGSGRKKLTIPESYRLTFGPLVPGGRDGHGTLALRVYSDVSKKNVVATFRDVKSFREIGSITIIEERVSEKQDAFYRKDDRGQQRKYEGIVRESNWIDPDDDEPEADPNQLRIEGLDD